MTARASGCSEPCSTAAARRRVSAAARPSARGVRAVTLMAPVVRVPVLSRTTVSMRRSRSRARGPLTRIPSWAPRPVAASSAVGVARPRAQGQATTRTATAAVTAACGAAPAPSQNPRTVTETVSTAGTKTAATVSASRCTAVLPVWASSTSRVIRASWVSAPTASARTTSSPPELTAPPTTRVPGPASTGRLSPLTSDRSRAERPSVTVPSVATFSPGRTRNSSPTRNRSTGMRCSVPSRRTATSLAASAASERSAEPVPRRALASIRRPASTNSTTPTAASRYSCAPGSPAVGSRVNGMVIPGAPAPPRNRA